MRRRSNAIHSQSQQEYMLLAEFSQECAGYFYDEKFRQEVDKKINRHRETLVAQKLPTTSQTLSGFDYSPHQQQIAEEEKEIGEVCVRKELVMAVIVSSVPEAVSALAARYQAKVGERMEAREERSLDLFMVGHSEALIKIWIIEHSQTHNPLFQAYLTRCKKVIDCSSSPSQEEAQTLYNQIQQSIGWSGQLLEYL